jgi:hypothetical protein
MLDGFPESNRFDPDFYTCPYCAGLKLTAVGRAYRLRRSRLFECASCHQFVAESSLTRASVKRRLPRLTRRRVAQKRRQSE